MMTIKIISDVQELSRYRDEWNSILSRALNNNVFLTYEWMSTWWDVFSSGKRLFVMLVEEGGIPVGIVPLYEEEHRLMGVLPIRQYFFLANRFVGSDFLDFIICRGKEKEVLSKVLDYFASSRSWDRLAFEDVDSESPLLGFFCTSLERSGLSFQQRPGLICPYMPLPENPEAFMDRPDQAFKKSVQRYVKRLHRQHRINLELAVEEDRLDESLEKLFALHGERWNLSGSVGIFEDERMREFYQKISRALSGKGWLRLSSLQVDGKIEAMEYGISYDQKYYFLQSGCSQDGLKLKAGNALKYGVIESLLGKTKTFHFLRGGEPYKYDWGGLNKLTVNVEVFRGFKARCVFLTKTFLDNTLSLVRILFSRKATRIR